MAEKIIITRNEFNKAVTRANIMFMEVGESHSLNETDPLMFAAIGMQNMVFGSVLESELFDKEDK